MFPTELLLLLPFYSPLDCVWDYPGELEPERQNREGKTNLEFTGARDSEWQWHQLGHIQICTSPQTSNHAGIPPLSFSQSGCPSCCPTNRNKAQKTGKTHMRYPQFQTFINDSFTI